MITIRNFLPVVLLMAPVCSAASAQELADYVPDSIDLYVEITEPIHLVEFFESFFLSSTLSDRQLEMIEETIPEEMRDEISEHVELLKNALEDLRVAFGCDTKVEPPVWWLILEGSESGDLERAGDRIRELVELLVIRSMDEAALADDSPQRRLSRALERVRTDLVERDRIVVVSNSQDWDRELAAERRALLSDSRVFKRSVYSLSELDSRGTVFAFFKPAQIPYWLGQDLSRREWLGLGWNDLVGCSAKLSLPIALWDRRAEDSAMLVDACVLYTQPATGISKVVSEAYVPIESIPLSPVKPFRMIAKRLDPVTYYAEHEKMHDSIHGAGSYFEEQDEHWSHLGGFDVVRNRSAGLDVSYWFDTAGTRTTLRFWDIGDREAASHYLQRIFDIKGTGPPDFPYSKTTLLGYDAWFQNDDRLRRMYAHNGIALREEDIPLRRTGAVIADELVMQGSERFIEENLKSGPERTKPIVEILEEYQRDPVRHLTHTSDLFYVEVNWPESRQNAWENKKIELLKQRHGNSREAMRRFREMRAAGGFLPTDDAENGVWNLAEILAQNWIESFGIDVLAVRNADGSIVLQWIAQREPESDDTDELDGEDRSDRR